MNPLSANGQCKTIQESEDLVRKLYESIHFCKIMIDAGNLVVFYDPHLECREILHGQPFLQTIGNMKPDIKKLWLILKSKYTKFLAVNAAHDSIDVCVNSSINGMIHSQLFGESKKWLGFFCFPVLDRKILASYNGTDKNVFNFFDIEHIKNIVPIYELNPKHRKYFYVADSGENVSPMPKPDDEAQGLLFSSKCIPSNPDKWGYCRNTQGFYRFKKTHPEREIYHGFLSPLEEVPEEIKKLLK